MKACACGQALNGPLPVGDTTTSLPGSRARIWGDALARLGEGEGEEVIDVSALAAHELNGRQIKNALQLAVALAQSEGARLAQRHLEATVLITTAFIAETAGEGGL